MKGVELCLAYSKHSINAPRVTEFSITSSSTSSKQMDKPGTNCIHLWQAGFYNGSGPSLVLGMGLMGMTGRHSRVYAAFCRTGFADVIKAGDPGWA